MMMKQKLLFFILFTGLAGSFPLQGIYAQVADYAWAKGIGGSGVDGAQDVAVDAAGNVYLTGYFEGSVDFDPGAGTATPVNAGEL